jgi:hypothetical protein
LQAIHQQMKTVAVVIPVYKKRLSAYEKISLQQCCRVLHRYDIVLAKPHSLDLCNYSTGNKYLHVENFEDAYFASLKGYNQLMLDPLFYERFLKYKFILIYQLDAFVFRDELEYWCSRRYDYVGAPWIVPRKSFTKHIKSNIRKVWHHLSNKKVEGSNVPTRVQFYNTVGNGGFSLRRVKKFHRLAGLERTLINHYIENSHHNHFNEDAFWSLEVNRRWRRLRIPAYKTALRFSIEEFPAYALQLNHNRLPFGCHAWNLFVPFWLPFFKQQGYDVSENKD